jgi:competence protein ComEC
MSSASFNILELLTWPKAWPMIFPPKIAVWSCLPHTRSQIVTPLAPFAQTCRPLRIAPVRTTTLAVLAVVALAPLTPSRAVPSDRSTGSAIGSKTPLPSKDLQIYFIDVEGGQSTLFVTPAGQSLLIDTGWGGNNGRDADRIVAAAKKAGIRKIDYVLITHFHADHVGGVSQLVDRIPIGTFIDHGDTRETGANADKLFAAYQQVFATGKSKRLSVKPGDSLPIQGIRSTVVSADGNLLHSPLPGAGQDNPACKDAARPADDPSENPRSLGTFFNFGKLRILDLGDLTSEKEMDLMCPLNKLGKVDVYIVSHHGSLQSGSPVLVHAISPRIAIMDNGAKKGGAPSTWEILEKTPHLEDLWQLHYSEEGAAAHNVANEFIANPDGPDAGNYLMLDARTDGSFDVFNSRTQQTKHYATK